MKKKLALGVAALGLGLGSLASAGSVSAAKPDSPGAGGKCVVEGVKVLRSLDGGVAAAARGEVDYAPFGSQEDGLGLIRLAFDGPAFLPLSTVITLHTTNPELFAWCD
jgi:hypothetical protein